MKTLPQTIDEARRELTALGARRAALERFVAAAVPLMNGAGRPGLREERTPTKPAPRAPKPAPGQGVWTKIRDVMVGKRVMALAEIATALAKQGTNFSDKPESRVRWAMKHHPETFRRVGPGRYTLRPK